MIFKENLTEILDGIRPFLLPLNSYYIIAYREEIPNGCITLCAFCFLFVAQFAYFRMFVIYYGALSYTK